MKNILPPELDKKLYHEIGQILQMKPIYVKPGLTEKQKEQGYLVHMATTLTEMFQRKFSPMKLSELLEFMSDAWVEAEVATNSVLDKKFRIEFFTRLEKHAHENGFKCDYEDCEIHKYYEHKNIQRLQI